MEIGVTGSGRLQRPDPLAGISEASNSIGGIGAVALIQLRPIYTRQYFGGISRLRDIAPAYVAFTLGGKPVVNPLASCK